MDHYKILGLKPGASLTEIRQAYRQLAKKLHPDVNKNPDAAARFQELQKAFKALTSKTKAVDHFFGDGFFGDT